MHHCLGDVNLGSVSELNGSSDFNSQTRMQQRMQNVSSCHLPDALVVLTAPPGEEWRAGTEAAQDTGPPVLAAAATLLSTSKIKKRQTLELQGLTAEKKLTPTFEGKHFRKGKSYLYLRVILRVSYQI